MKNVLILGTVIAATLFIKDVSACTVRADAKDVEIGSSDRNYLVRYPTGQIERVVRYTARGNFFLQECGSARGIDTRECIWKINTWIVREIGTKDPEGDISFKTKDKQTKIFTDNLDKDGGPIIITRGHKATCSDRLGEWQQDGEVARVRVKDAIPSVVNRDQPSIAEIFSKKGGKIVQ